jgi:nucleoid DNA-binding protein
MTKAQIIAELAEKTGLSKKQVAGVFDALNDTIKKNLGNRGPGLFVIPGLVKLTVRKRPATKEREGINPFTKEKIIIKAKPARKVVKASALKALKDLVL